jgi:hypothetical protein
MEWKYLGNISKCFSIAFGGVYLITHLGCYHRILYVGTSNNIGRRMQQHYEGYFRGNRTIWKVTKSEDAYSLMTSFHITNYVNHYRKLAELNRIWASTTLEMIFPKNLLLPNQTFSDDWMQFLKHEYLPNIGIWALKISPYYAYQAVKMESAIQQRLVDLFKLGRFFNHRDLSVLGKIEFNNRRVKIPESFATIPEIDAASQMVFLSLNRKKLPLEAYELAEKQLHDVISERLKEKEIRDNKRESILERYPRQGSPWEPVDLEKLRVLLVDFNLSPKEMTKYLGRKPSTIAKRIEKNDKFSALRWRNSIKFL